MWDEILGYYKGGHFITPPKKQHIIIDGLNLLGYMDFKEKVNKCLDDKTKEECQKSESKNIIKSYIGSIRNYFPESRYIIHIVMKNPHKNQSFDYGQLLSSLKLKNVKIYIVEFIGKLNKNIHSQMGYDDAFALYLHQIYSNSILLSNDKYRDVSEFRKLGKCSITEYPSMDKLIVDFSEVNFIKVKHFQFNLQLNPA